MSQSPSTQHLLSFAGNLLALNILRATARRDASRTPWSLLFSKHSFNREENAFLKASDGAAIIGGVATSSSSSSSSHVEVVKCERALNVRRRAAVPCALLSQRSEKGTSVTYSLYALSFSSNSLEPCLEFKLPDQITEDVFILRGPTVLWSHAGSVFYKSVHTAEVRQTPVQLSHVLVGEFPHHRDQVFVLGLREVPNSQGQTVGCFVESGQVFDGDAVLPHPYISITRCMLVLSGERSEGDGRPLRCTLVTATSNQQLVCFEDGVVTGTCQLPFDDQPESIITVDTGRHGLLLVVSSQWGHVCAIWRESLQLASQWSDVSSVHADDFLRWGSDQMLLVFKDDGKANRRPLERFLLTDLCGISFTRCQVDDAPHPPLQENYLLTLRALESRLQSGLSVLQDLQGEAKVKQRVVQQSVQTLVDVLSGREAALTNPEQEGLVALWDDMDEPTQGSCYGRTPDEPSVSSKRIIDKLWHRVAHNRLVIGVMLTTDRPVASASLSILTETGQSSTPAVIQIQSQVFWLPAPSSSSFSTSLFSSTSPSSYPSASTLAEPAAKRSRQRADLTACRLAVTAATRLTPLLNSGCVKCSVTLHYVQKQDALAPASRSIMSVLYCGEIILDIRNGLQTQLLKNPNSELTTDEAVEDLLSLMTLLDHWVLDIKSPDYSLGDVEGWIAKKAGCKKTGASRCYVLESSGPSAPVLLHWHQITSFQGQLSIHGSHLQVLHFLDSFLPFLPISCSVQPVKCEQGPGAAQTFSSALGEEALSLRDAASSLLCDEEVKRKKSPEHQRTPGQTAAVGLQRCTEEWKLDAERSKMRLSPLVDADGYRWLTRRLLEVQLESDLAALSHAKEAQLS